MIGELTQRLAAEVKAWADKAAAERAEAEAAKGGKSKTKK